MHADVDQGGPRSFPSALRALRAAAGLTQSELAERAGLTTDAVSLLERGARSRPYPHTVRSIADALGLSEPERAALLSLVPQRPDSRPPLPIGPPPVAHALGVPDTALLGREADLAAVTGLLADGRRLVTLTGTGGVGKTRLAAAAAAIVAADFPDGLVVVPLAAARSADEVLPALARTVAAQTTPGCDLVAELIAVLAPRRALVVLDNLEQVLAAAPAVAELVAGCPRLVVLATSRAPLRVRAETEHAVAPLAVPPARAGVGPTPSPAAALFLDRARTVARHFAAAPTDLAVVEELCRRLGGIPLALELAASRARALGPQALLDRLGEADLAPARDLPARQQTMRATLDWSYGLLREGEQRLFRRLSVFPDTFDLAAAEAVATGAGEHGAPAVLGHLEALVEHSLVVVQPDGRCRLLPPVAEHGRLLLDDAERADVVARHARHFLAFARRAHEGFAHADQLGWLARAEREDDNLLQAVQTAADSGDAATAAWLCWELQRFWWFRQRVEPGLRLCERVLALCAAREDDPQSLAVVSMAAGAMALALDRREASAAHWRRALGLAGHVSTVAVTAHANAGLGLVALTGGDPQTALVHLRQAHACAQAAGPAEEWIGTMSQIWAGSALAAAGDADEARAWVERGLREARGRGDQMAAYMALYALSHSALRAGRSDEARQHLVKGVRLAGEIRDVNNVAHFVQSLVVIEAADGDPARAVVLSSAAEELLSSARAGASYRLLDPDTLAAAVADARGRLGAAADRAAQRTGRAMSLDDVVEHVLAGPARLRAVDPQPAAL